MFIMGGTGESPGIEIVHQKNQQNLEILQIREDPAK